jgi:hypothetical protein
LDPTQTPFPVWSTKVTVSPGSVVILDGSNPEDVYEIVFSDSPGAELSCDEEDSSVDELLVSESVSEVVSSLDSSGVCSSGD